MVFRFYADRGCSCFFYILSMQATHISCILLLDVKTAGARLRPGERTHRMKIKTAHCAFCLLAILTLISSLLPAASAEGTEFELQTYALVIPIQTAADDLEELLSDGTADAGSPDIELGVESPGDGDARAQIVGLRFAGLPILRGAAVTEAYIQFTVDEVKYPADPFDVTIAAEDTANSAPFYDGDTAAHYALSSRARTAQSVGWAAGEGNKVVWKSAGQSGKAQRTPDLSALVQAVIDKEDWTYGNAVAFLITGAGNRTAYAYERESDKAAALHISFTAANATQPAPEGLMGVMPTTILKDDGMITGTTEGMEYRPVYNETAPWTPCGGETVTGLAAGDYEVRFAARICYNAGEAATVHIPLYAGDVTLQPGADETEMNFAWSLRGFKATESIVEIAPASAMADGVFPEAAAQAFSGESVWVDAGYRAYEVTATGLAANTEYVYRLGDGGNWSAVFRFATRDAANYCAILVGDPQLGASGDTAADGLAWQETVTRALTAFPEAGFILSAGDHVQASGSETQYETFFAPGELRRIPFVPTVGNHDDNQLFARHFNVPNESAYGRTVSGYDYWFTYGNTLYMVLNSNNRNAGEHDAFMEKAVAAAGEGVKWKIVLFHHAIYSSAAHSVELGILSLRLMLYPLMDKYDIDVALSGHDHCYTRTFQMLGNVAQNGLESVAVNPEGTLYVTTGSASGSLIYPLQKTEDILYRAVRWPDKEASYSLVTVGDAALSITTYRTSTNEVIDSYTIIKDPSAPAGLQGVAPTAVNGADGMITGTSAGMEYRRAPDAGWTACGGEAITGLAPGTYAVRYQAAGQDSASAAVTVTVPGVLPID